MSLPEVEKRYITEIFPLYSELQACRSETEAEFYVRISKLAEELVEKNLEKEEKARVKLLECINLLPPPERSLLYRLYPMLRTAAREAKKDRRVQEILNST